MEMAGGTIKEIIYERDLPFMLVSRRLDTLKVYLNPRVMPNEIIETKEILAGVEILFLEGDFAPQDNTLFFPILVVVVNRNGITDWRLKFV